MNVSCQTLTLPWSEEALDGCDSLLFVCLLCPTSLLPVFATCITVPSSASGMEQGSIRILKQWHTFARNYVFWHWDKKKSCPYPICLNCCWELPWSLYHSRFGMPLFQCFITLNTVFFFFFSTGYPNKMHFPANGGFLSMRHLTQSSSTLFFLF